MERKLIFSKEAIADMDFFRKSGQILLLKRIKVLLASVLVTPYSGIGKPEALKYHYTGYWSRHINKEHRLVYIVTDTTYIYIQQKGIIPGSVCR